MADIYDLYNEAQTLNGFFRDPTAQKQMANGLLGTLNRAAISTAGAPVDLTTMALRALGGYRVPDDKVVGSSEWIGKKLENAGMLSKTRNPIAELLGGFVSPDPMDAMKLSAMVMPAIAKASKADDMVDLYHGSYQPIEAIKDSGIFGGLFASGKREAAASHGKFLHKISLGKDEILTQRALDYDIDYDKVASSIKKQIRNATDDDVDVAYKAIVEDKSLHDMDVDEETLRKIFGSSDLSEASWEAQRMRGQLAKQLGYKAVEMNDEHGTSYLVLPGTPINPD